MPGGYESDPDVLLVLFDLRDSLARMESKLDSALSQVETVSQRVDVLERLVR